MTQFELIARYRRLGYAEEARNGKDAILVKPCAGSPQPTRIAVDARGNSRVLRSKIASEPAAAARSAGLAAGDAPARDNKRVEGVGR